MTVEQFEVRNRWTNAVQFTAEITVTPDMSYSVKLGLAVKWAVKSGADLSWANLSGVNLLGANLSRADLSWADLSRAYLSGANLLGANLSRADLSRANLSGVNLLGANLSRADLSWADLSRAYLSGANLSEANLSRAYLSEAYLSGANLSEANLSGANLSGAKNAELVIVRTRILPEGDLIGWKKCLDGVIVKLRIPEAASRSHAFGRKCRAEYADVLEVIGADVGIAQHDNKTEYRVGERVTAPNWCDDWQRECAGGIHFFITRAEAEAY